MQDRVKGVDELVRHVLREGNGVTDYMAKLALKMPHRDLMRWSNPPEDLNVLLNQDILGGMLPRKALD